MLGNSAYFSIIKATSFLFLEFSVFYTQLHLTNRTLGGMHESCACLEVVHVFTLCQPNCKFHLIHAATTDFIWECM